MPHTRPQKRPEPYPLPASSKSRDLPVECHEWQVGTVLLANGLFLVAHKGFLILKEGAVSRLHVGIIL